MSILGCAQHSPQTIPVPQPYASTEQGSAMQRPARAIIHFRRATSDSPELSAAIAAACHCQPVFFRRYPGDALIYSIVLPPESSFAAFAEILMRDAEQLGIRAVEQDGLMQHQ